MFVDYSGRERYTDINASFGKLVNTYCCFQRCEAISEQLEILKSLVPKCHDIVALTDEDFASGHTAGLTQKLFAMAMTLHQITDCIDLLQKCNTIIPIEIANPASFESGAATAPLRQSYARLLDDWSHYMGPSTVKHTGCTNRPKWRFPWQQSRTIIIPMLFIGETAMSTRDLRSVLHDCEIRHASEMPLQLLWTSSPELVYATPHADDYDIWSRYGSDYNMQIEDEDEASKGRQRKCVVQLEALLGALPTTDPLFQW